MPTSHSSNFFQAVLLNIINPLLKLNHQSFRRLHQVFFDWSDIDLIDHRSIVLPKGVLGQTFQNPSETKKPGDPFDPRAFRTYNTAGFCSSAVHSFLQRRHTQLLARNFAGKHMSSLRSESQMTNLKSHINSPALLQVSLSNRNSKRHNRSRSFLPVWRRARKKPPPGVSDNTSRTGCRKGPGSRPSP